MGIAEGNVPHGSPDTGSPVGQGLNAQADISAVAPVDVGDRVRQTGTLRGAQIVAYGSPLGGDGQDAPILALSDSDIERPLCVVGYGVAPDTFHDRIALASSSGPGFGAQNVAPIGGDVTIRASSVIGEASGTSTAVDNLGWVKSFVAHLDVTQTRTGGSSNTKLDVYLQTQLASGDWQDIVHWTQIGVSVTAEIVDWGPVAANFSGIAVEGTAITFDRFFAEQDAGLAVTTARVMNLGDSMRVKHVYIAGDSTTSDYIFAVEITAHS